MAARSDALVALGVGGWGRGLGCALRTPGTKGQERHGVPVCRGEMWGRISLGFEDFVTQRPFGDRADVWLGLRLFSAFFSILTMNI